MGTFLDKVSSRLAKKGLKGRRRTVSARSADVNRDCGAVASPRRRCRWVTGAVVDESEPQSL